MVPLLLVFLLLSFYQFGRAPSLLSLSLAVLAVAVLVMGTLARVNALKVQDRLIRLEERLRMAELLPDDLRSRALDLSVGQYVALRFASDAELASLVRQTLDAQLTPKQIKDRIINWRPDYCRV